jgi:hypothetical protein
MTGDLLQGSIRADAVGQERGGEAIWPGRSWPKFVTYANRPKGSTATEAEFCPAGKGDPGTVVNEPSGPMWKAKTLPTGPFAI